VAISNGVKIALALFAGAGVFAGIVMTVPQQGAPGSESAAGEPEAEQAAAEVAAADAPAGEAPAAEVAEGSDVAAEGAAEEPAEAEVAEPAETEVADEVAEAPRVETLRVEPDGMTVIAGRAAAGATIAVMLGAEVVAEVVADAGGEFVALVSLPPSEAPRSLSLVSDPAGVAVMSEETWLVAPTTVAVADAGEAGVATEAEGELEVSAAETATPEAESEQAGMAVADDAAAGTEEVMASAGTVEGGAEVVAPEDEVAAAEAVEGGAEPGAVEDVVAVAEPVAGGVETAAAEDVVAFADQVDGGADAVAVDEEMAAELDEGNAEGVAATDEAAVTEEDTLAVADGVVSEGDTEAVAVEDPAGTTVVASAEVVAELPGADGTAVGDGAVTGETAPETDDQAAEVAVAEAGEAVPEVSVEAPGLAEPAPVEMTAPPVLVSDAEGVRVVQPALAQGAGPEVLTTVAVDAIAYDADGGVELSGRAAGGGSVRIYVDNAPLTDIAVDDDGQWAADLTDLAAGVYTLRVDQLDAAGEVTSRVETPFLREERESIAQVMAAETGAEGFEVAVQTVQPGNTLWAIARDRYGDGVMYVQVFEANRDRIRNPDLIYPGQIFMLPSEAGAP
jgi:nucleoid-associated protein YgaU